MKLCSLACQNNVPWCEIDGSLLPVNTFGKCFGYWWLRNVTASKAVDDIKRAKKSLLCSGPLGSFQGNQL